MRHLLTLSLVEPATLGAFDFLVSQDPRCRLRSTQRGRGSQVIGPDCIGVLVHLVRPEQEQEFLSLPIPVINVSGVMAHSRLPRVTADNRQMGRDIAETFLARGYRHLATLERTFEAFAIDRAEAFAETGLLAGASVARHVLNGALTGANEMQRFLRFARNLPKPCGLMCVSDDAGAEALGGLVEAGLAVPADIALISVGDAATQALTTPPGLSSVRMPWRRIGYQAARLAWTYAHDPQARAGPVPDLRVTSDGMTERGSTGPIAIDDSIVRDAVQIMLQRAHEGINIEKLLAEINVSRSTLETRFRQVVGRSPLQELIRIRLLRAADLLVRTDLKVEEVAQRSGFTSDRRLRAAFLQRFGRTPQQYRASMGSTLLPSP